MYNLIRLYVFVVCWCRLPFRGIYSPIRLMVKPYVCCSNPYKLHFDCLNVQIKLMTQFLRGLNGAVCPKESTEDGSFPVVFTNDFFTWIMPCPACKQLTTPSCSRSPSCAGERPRWYMHITWCKSDVSCYQFDQNGQLF